MAFISRSPRTTKSLARLLAQELLKSRPRTKGAMVIALQGELGSGKTTFIQGFAKGLGIKRRITSPTFLLIRSYKLKVKSYKLLFHVDAYRIKRPQELIKLGFKEIVADPKNIVVIEWADKIKRLLPKKGLWVEFEHGEHKKERTTTLGIN